MANLNLKEMAKIAINKKLCKEYCDISKGTDNFIVYLNNGDEFQIQLFNPTNQVIGVKLKFNNEHKEWLSSNNYIVLRPGERVWLERFLDSHDKFIFNTYEVSNSTQVLEAIKDNGDIIVEFYYEDSSDSSKDITPLLSNLYFNTFTYKPDYTYYCGDSVNNISSPISYSGFTNSATTSTSDADITASLYSYTRSGSIGPIRCLKKSAKTIETGRVEHGSYSGQNFKNVYYKFESWPFTIKHFKLLPVSRKQYSDNDLKNIYCTNCGKKLLPKFKYCPACGTKVNN